MEPDVSVEGAAVIRVVILQVGEVSASVFREYASLVMRQCRIDLYNVRSFYTEIQKSPFPSEKYWDGYLRFKYIIGSAPRVEWENFQANRKIHGVIGICHCPHSPDIGEAYEDFMRACRAYPSAQAKRCFAFDPTEEQVGQDDSKRKHLILFPWGDPQKLVGDMMLDFASDMVMAFESWVVHANGTVISTPLDKQASLSSEEVTKRRLGRIQKAIGDYCLLAGSALDAHKHYKSALDVTKLCNDLFWQAGALEGITTAIVMDTGEKTELLETTVRENYKEVLQLYRRSSAPLFEVEATIKLARFLCRKEHAKNVVELLSSAIEEARKLVDGSDRLIIYVEVSKIFAELGYERKAAFFARQVAQVYQAQESRYAAISALQILSLTTPLYKVQPQSSMYAADPSMTREGQSYMEQSKHGSLVGQKGAQTRVGEWTNLQIAVLGDIVSMAMRAGEPLVAWGAAARLLRNHYPLITPKGQEALASALAASAARLPHGTRSSNLALPFVRLHSFPSSPGAAQTVKRTLGKKDWWNGPPGMGPFIYTPFSARISQDKDEAETLWVAGEITQVMVELANPCSFEVSIESISLSVTGDFEAFPMALSIPPNTSSQLLPLAGVPRSEGPATVRGCFVRCYGVLVEHCFDQTLEISCAALETVLADPFRGVDAIKRRIPPSPEILVLPPLPLLVAEWEEGEGAPVLFEGEMRELKLKLTNMGAVPAISADIAVLGRQKEHVSFVDFNALENALPLLPGASVCVTVGLLAQFLTGNKPEVGRGKGGKSNHGGKDDPNVVLAIHYAGPEEPIPSEDDGLVERNGQKPTSSMVPPGRRLPVPLELHVQRGLQLVKAQLLAMGGAAGGNGGMLSRDGGKAMKLPRAPSKGDKDLAVVPVREGKGLRLLELELWNGTDVSFEISTFVTLAPETGTEKLSDGGKNDVIQDKEKTKSEATSGHRCTRIDRECSARVLIPLESFQSGAVDALSRPPHPQPGTTRQSVLPRNAALAKAALEQEAVVEAICSRITVQWQSGRNSSGKLPIRRAVREALEGSALDILLPDLVSFSFHLRPAGGNSSSGGKSSGVFGNGGRESRDNEELVARELTLVDLVVHNSSDAAMVMSLSVTCRDVRGASCMGGGPGQKTTALWAGVMNGAEVMVPPWGEAIHQFYLCFLIPGDYSLLAAAVVELPASNVTVPLPVPSSGTRNEPQQICCSGIPHRVVVGSSVGSADLSMPLFD